MERLEKVKSADNMLGACDPDVIVPEPSALVSRIRSLCVPPGVRRKLDRDLSRLARIADTSAEHGTLRRYLEIVSDLPWTADLRQPICLHRARKILDEDLYGLDRVKAKVLEFLAVEKLNPEGASPIICFIGPPGVGKTRLSQSIARALDRPFSRLSLNGLQDEARIRGHTMTAPGAMPGNIITTIGRAKARNCVLMIDSIDRLGTANSRQGDPLSALLEVLDPDFNFEFRDDFLAMPFDLSRIFFIASANVLWDIPRALQDRVEVIEIPGYTDEEKLHIAKRFLVKSQRRKAGLTPTQCNLTTGALKRIVRDYTREAGVWDMARMIGAVFRHAAVEVAQGRADPISVSIADLTSILGPARYEDEVAMRNGESGVSTGLAWTPVGGEILFIETALSVGSGRMILTGQLGDVMKESAQAAMTLLKIRADFLGIDPQLFITHDVHIHVPAGAISKDGPSAGVTIFCALASVFSGRCVKSDTAMTGEISLRGLVLPVGGIKDKMIAAARANIKTVLLPARNKKDFGDVPESAKSRLRFVWIKTVDDALRHVLECD